MDRKKIVLQSVLVSGIVCLGAVLSAQALSLKSDVTTTNTSGLGTGTSLNTNINTSTTVTTTTTTTSTSTATDANIQFNEFSGDSTTGWVELYNAGSTPVDVTNWVILSNKGNSQILTGIVTPYGYATFNGITADSLATLQSDSGQVIDTQTYTAVTTSQSWSQYTTNVFACDASPTKLAANAKVSCTTATNSNSNTNTNTNTTNRNTTNTNKNTNTTNTNKTTNTNSNKNTNTNTNSNSNTNANTNTATTTETTGGVNATSSLYIIDRAWESLRLALTVDDEKEAELSLAYAAERLAEANDIVTEEQQTQVGETNTNNTNNANNTNNTNNVNTQQTATTDITSTVKLSEIVHKDYIELYNPGTKAVDITGYTLEVKDAAGLKTYVLPTIIVEAGKYVGIFAKTSGLELDEAGGRVRLLDTTATAVSATIVPYDVYANAWAFNLTTKQWDCTSTATKEAVNAFADCVTKTDEQVAVNDNTNTTNQNTNTANTNQQVNNQNTNSTNTNQVAGNTNQTVTNTNTEVKDTDQDGLTDEVETENATNPEVADTDGDGVNDANDPEPTTDEKTDENQDDSSQTDSQVWLSEVVHKDYIELFNPGTTAIDLTGYVLEVNDSVSTQSYTLPGIIIEPGKYVAVFSIDSGLKVPTNGGIVSLLNSSKTVIDKTIVPLGIIGNSWSFNSTAVKWDCTSMATKEAVNAFADCVTKTDEQVAVNQNTNAGTNENVNVEEENTNAEVENNNTNEVTNENVNEPEENTNEAVTNENENTNEVVNENTNEAVEEETPADTDGDGISDELEKEAGTNSEQADTDGDGVDDANDQTPTEAGVDEGTELSEEAAAAVEETMTDFEELVDHAGEQEVSEEAAATNAETLTELVDEIEAIQEDVAGETDQSLEDAKTNAEEEVAVLENGDEGEATNENVNEPEENTNEAVTNENENTNEVVNENGDENINGEEENTNGEVENTNDNSNENANEDTNTNNENTNEADDNTNALSNDNTNSESNDAVVTEDIDAQRLQEELDLAIDEINKLREENEALQAKVKELEDKLYKTTGEDVSKEDANTNLDSGTQSSLTGNDKYSIVTRESELPDFTNVDGHVYFRELRAQPGDFTSTPGEYAFHNLDKVMYKLTLPDGNTSAAIYPGEVFIMDLEGGEYTYSSVNHPDFGPYKITIE